MAAEPFLKTLRVAAAALVACVNLASGADFPHKTTIDSIVTPLIETDEVVGAAVGIVTPQGSWVLGYGSTIDAGDTPPDGDTIFEIGSLTKVFTGVMLAGMVQQNRVSLDDPVRKYLPQTVVVPAVGGREMTIRHLATHTAGLPPDPTNLRPRDPLNRFEGYTLNQLYACLSGHSEIASSKHHTPERSLNEEKTDYRYSNFGVGLLGHLLERSERKAYEQLVREYICDELMLTDTHITPNDGQRQRLAHGYYFYDRLAPSCDAGCIPAYGGLRSTVNDLLKFLTVHLNNNDSKIALAAKLASSPQQTFTNNLRVGLCWHIDSKSGVVWHGGTTAGFTSAMAFHKESGVGVVVLTNSKSIVITPLAGVILGSIQGKETKPIPIRRRIQIDQERLESYEGTYQDKSQPFLSALRSSRIVVRDGKHLTVKGISGEEFPLYPESETRFFCKGEDINAIFRFDEGSKTLELDLSLWGYKSTLTKIRAP